jgi:hypothetical protein
MTGEPLDRGGMGRSSEIIPVGALAAVLVIAAVTGIIGGALLALREGPDGPASSAASVTIFIRDSATPAQLKALEAKIRSAPGVQAYEYFTKKQTIRRIRDGRPEVMLASFAAAASYVIHVKDAAQAYAVAQRFFYDPAVNSDPGTHDGVLLSTRIGVPPAHTGSVGRVFMDPFPGDYTVEARPTAGNPWFRPEKRSVLAGRWSRVDIYAQIQ